MYNPNVVKLYWIFSFFSLFRFFKNCIFITSMINRIYNESHEKTFKTNITYLCNKLKLFSEKCNENTFNATLN